MATAKKLKSGSWRIRVFSHFDTGPGGKKKPVYESFTVRDPSRAGKRECERLAAEWAANRPGRDRDVAEKTVQELVRSYIDLKEGVLSPATIRGYENYFKASFADVKHYCVGSLTPQIVQGWVNGLAARYTPKYTRNVYALFTASVRFAGADLPFRITLPAPLDFQARVPCDDDVKILLDYLREPPKNKRTAECRRELLAAIMLAAFGSLRRGEICALTPKDFNGCRISVSKDMVKDKSGAWIIKPTPKTSTSNRVVELPPFAIKQIELPERGRVIKAHPEQISNRFRRAIRSCGVDIPFRFHDLRHYYVSISHALGVPDAYIQEAGGWKTDRVMKQVYRSTLADRAKMEQDKLNGHFSSKFNRGG